MQTKNFAAVPHQKNLYLLIQLLLPTKDNANGSLVSFGSNVLFSVILFPNFKSFIIWLKRKKRKKHTKLSNNTVKENKLTYL